jgi:prepilin-type N-terminal cleavage/methylation domain-containing protein
MNGRIKNKQSAFTLVEIMIVSAIIGLMATLAIPGFVEARKQTQGRLIINDARQEDAAIKQWALETGLTDGATVNTTGATTYLKTAWATNDALGNPYTYGNVGTQQVQIAAATKKALAKVGIDWGPY